MPGQADIIAKFARIMNQDANETFNQARHSLEALYNFLVLLGGTSGAGAVVGICSAGMAPSTTVIVCGNLANLYEDDAFDSRYTMVVLKNANSLLAAPEMERRDITDFVGTTATFTVDAFSAVVEEDDVVLIMPYEAAAMISAFGILTTSSATAPADVTRRGGEASDYWNGCLLMPVAGACRFQPRRISDFTTGTGVMTLDVTTPFTAVPGLVPYVILPSQGSSGMDILASGTFTTNSATVPADTGRTEGNDYWKGCVLMPIAGVCAFQPRPIRQYTVTTDVFTLDEPFTAAPGAVQYVILRAEYPIQRLLDIFGETNAILELLEAGGSVTTDGTEQTVWISNIPAAVFKPLTLMLDCTDMAAGDSITVRVYYRLYTGGGLIKETQFAITNAQDPALWSIDLNANRHGIQITVQETAGAHNNLPWSVLWEG